MTTIDKSSTSTSTRSKGASRIERVHLVLRLVSMLVGLPLLALALASCIALLIGNPWVALILALVFAIVPALYLADRLLPAKDPLAGRGIPTDVLSLVWLSGATIAFGPLGGLLHAPLDSFLERLAGRGALVDVADFATGDGSEPRGSDVGIDAGSAHATAHIVDAGPAPAPVVPEIVEAAPVTDASVAAPPPPPPADALSPSEIFRQFAGSVVTIEVVLGGTHEGQRGSGTGFFIDAHGVLATNHHVIENARAARVKLLDGTFADSVRVLAEDREHDLALLSVQTTHPIVPVRLADSEQVVVGERVAVIGNPLGLDHTLSDGIISARRRLESREMIQITAPLSPGNSGGPVFDLHGQVIGVSTAVVGLGYAQNLNLAVPINALKAMIRADYPNAHPLGDPSAAGSGGHW